MRVKPISGRALSHAAVATFPTTNKLSYILDLVLSPRPAIPPICLLQFLLEPLLPARSSHFLLLRLRWGCSVRSQIDVLFYFGLQKRHLTKISATGFSFMLAEFLTKIRVLESDMWRRWFRGLYFRNIGIGLIRFFYSQARNYKSVSVCKRDICWCQSNNEENT